MKKMNQQMKKLKKILMKMKYKNYTLILTMT